MADSDNSNGSTPQKPTFMSGLMAGLNGLGSNPLFNVGMGLMNAARPYGNVGESLMQANQVTAQNQAAQQSLAINRINAQKAQAMWPMYQKVLERAVNGPGGTPQQAAPSTPQSGQQPPPNQYRAPAPLAPIGGDPTGDVAMGNAMGVLSIPGAENFTNSPKNLQAAQEFLTKQRQAQVAPQMSILDTIAGAANADDIVKSDPELKARWGEVAPRLGLNPATALTPENARAFGRYAYNEFAGTSQLPTKPMPDIFDQIPGSNGQVIQKNRTTGAITEPIPQKLPTFSLEKQWDPTTGKDVGIMVQTSPGGSAAPAAALSGSQGAPANGPKRPTTGSASGTAPKSGIGTTTPGTIDLGFQKPDDANQKAANFANYSRTNVAAMKQMEDSGYRMPPTIRAAVIDAATSEDGSKLSQLFSQEVLANKLSPDDMKYMAALMPVLQASGHSMSGARLTTSQMRTNFESLIPLDSKDPDYLGTVADNRKHLYNGLLAQAGNAVHMPEFEPTLGADVEALQKNGTKGAPAIGTVSKGFKYIGGDPAKPTSWQKSGQ